VSACFHDLKIIMPRLSPVVDAGVAKIMKYEILDCSILTGFLEVLFERAKRAYVFTIAGKHIIVPQ
jgi:hypothetical protein